MKYTVDTLKRVISINEPTNLCDLMTHLQKMYGDEWVNWSIVSQEGGCYHNDIINNYYGSDTGEFPEPSAN